MAELTVFYSVLLIILAVILIVAGSLGVNLFNRTKSSADSVAKNEDIFFIITLVVGLITLLIPIVVFIYNQNKSTKTT
uniref:Transmembrane protein n=1 Tax=Pithovirus LCPAC406 TaxID=2506599 RepID=A0A481ZFV7_9VIRU|nr:MAG: uncharacterized protein LCPAC406_01140 [Pithovirus LCPAC406]